MPTGRQQNITRVMSLYASSMARQEGSARWGDWPPETPVCPAMLLPGPWRPASRSWLPYPQGGASSSPPAQCWGLRWLKNGIVVAIEGLRTRFRQTHPSQRVPHIEPLWAPASGRQIDPPRRSSAGVAASASPRMSLGINLPGKRAYRLQGFPPVVRFSPPRRLPR
jgi:hypothetical protein